ncbi:hypothetical protein [Algoriphagus sp. AK58]|uniref:hypothetical protein n=1 Tax=Algoriphagus sp. AK58 TaxID=1406877 RepID=UPI00164FE99D|nr:hypothetical protein [Algoriphagus sp. AK58]MBC6365848.1 hypothetical protein [Algoriphagus sp. AK58]
MKDQHINRIAVMMVALSLVLIGACNYYKPVTTSPKYSSSDKTKEIASLSQKTFIIRSNRGDFLLQNPVVLLDQEALTGTLQLVPEENQLYIKDDSKKYAFSESNPAVLQELHVYTSLDSTAKIGANVSIPVSGISKMELIQKDKSKSSTNSIILASGVTLGALAVAAIIATAVAAEAIDSSIPSDPESSCPFVNAYDGKEFVFQGEIFGGALFPSVARQDFLPLPALAIGPDLQLMISNERKENQYIDMADLLLVEHDPGQKVLADPKGPLFLVQNLSKPTEAILNAKIPMLERVSNSDFVFCSFHDVTANSSLNELRVKFDNPGPGKDLALYLNLRDSPSLEFIFEEYMSNYGEEYPAFENMMASKPAEELYLWQEMNLVPLTISVKTDQGWKEVSQTRFVGPIMNREIAISLEGLDLKEPILEFSLKTGFLYWEIDQLALATVKSVSPEFITVLKPAKAVDENGGDKLALISEFDSQFVQQQKTGNLTSLSYRFKVYSEEKTYSAFLHTSGYYQPNLNFDGPKNEKFFAKYEKPGGLADYSMRRFLEVSQFASSSAK